MTDTAERVTDDDGWTLRSATGCRTAHSEHTIASTRDGAEIRTVSPQGVRRPRGAPASEPSRRPGLWVVTDLSAMSVQIRSAHLMAQKGLRMCWYQDLDLAASARSIGVARERATSHLVAVAPDLQGSDVLWDLELMLSEMVTNSLRAGASDIFVATQMHRDHVRITVGDDAAGWPQRRSASADEDSGRGLAILEAVSDAWGIVGDSGHKEVWVLMQVPDEVRTPPDCVL